MSTSGRRRRGSSIAVVAAALVVAMSGPGVPAAGAADPPTPVRRCNGMARLCDRSIGEVAFATAHNAMSSPADGFRGPNQGKPISWQLEHGIRGFQIDAYEGVERDGSVYTDLTVPLDQVGADLSPELAAAARRIHRSLGAPPPGTPTDVYLCHTFCELGAVKFVDVLADVREFLAEHPDEVLVMVVEDSVEPERLRAAFAQAGLDQELVAVEPGNELPTLRQLIDGQTRLFVSLERGDGGPTLPNAFESIVEETPFTFVRPSALRAEASCGPNRGVEGAPVFQFNHWVTPPVPSAARAVNRRVLRDRVERCTELRGRGPTLVAVDFAEHSDVVDVVERLNRAAR